MEKLKKEKFSNFISSIKEVSFLIYIAKCIIGTSICYLLYFLFPKFQFNWSIVSLLLVLSQQDTDAKTLAISRIQANSIGASIGLLFFLIRTPNLIMLCIAVVITILFCTFIKLGNASRSALAALAIVMIQERENLSGSIAYQRMICVLVGCVIALILTYIFSFFSRKINK